MIREERDPAFWEAIAGHPDVAPGLYGMSPEAIGRVAIRPDITPLASDNGGFLFAKIDALGFVRDLHVLYRPAGWGAEVTAAAVEALQLIFETAQVVSVFELAVNRNSRPPRSFGFRLAGDFRRTTFGFLRAWVLTQAAWEASPVHGRHICRQ